MVRRPYCPNRGDIVWIDFSPQAGHEQYGRRPALSISHGTYNKKVGLAVFCPITGQIKGYPFEVNVGEGLPVHGVVLSDQAKSLDWRARNCEFACVVPAAITADVLKKLMTLLR